MDMMTEMIEHELIQGTPEWLEFRMSHDGASEAAAMLGISKKMSRNELLRMKSSGITKEFSDWVQKNILDYGHEVEAMARPIVEKQLGTKLYPVTCSRGRMSASCDGKNMAGVIGWEHKQWNKELAASVSAGVLPDEHWPQVQQELLVTGAEKWIFTVSDGTDENMVSMDVLPDPEKFETLRAGWAQFNKDRENYVHVEAKPEAVGLPIKDLPAVTYEISGLSVFHNIDTDVKPAVVAMIEKYKRKPETDQDFADLDAFNKKARAAVDRSEAVRATFKAKFVDIDAFERSLVELEDLLTAAAIAGEKTFKSEKDNRKARILDGGKQKYTEHMATLQVEIVGVTLVVPAPDWIKAVHGLKSLDSYQNAVDSCLANAIISSEAIAADVRTKLAWCKEHAAGMSALFPDLQALMVKPFDDFTLTITSRIEKQKADESAKMEAVRVQAEADARAKLEAEAKAKEAEQVVQAAAPAAQEVSQPVVAPSPVRQDTQAAENAVIAAQDEISEFLKTRQFKTVKDENFVRAHLVQFVVFQNSRKVTK